MADFLVECVVIAAKASIGGFVISVAFLVLFLLIMTLFAVLHSIMSRED